VSQSHGASRNSSTLASGGCRMASVIDQYRHDRARRRLRGGELLAKAERAVDDKAPVKRNHHIQLTGAA